MSLYEMNWIYRAQRKDGSDDSGPGILSTTIVKQVFKSREIMNGI